MINLSTGPVSVSPRVMKALNEPPISHRSAAFNRLYHHTTDLLCEAFNVRHSFLLTGSGTLANEVMLHQIKSRNEKGLILSNGEFGNRLVEQAKRHHIDFETCVIEWGEQFEIETVKKVMVQNNLRWILFCHCETSTGVINDLSKLAELAKSVNGGCYVDCMSTVGTVPLDLSGVQMATASSGKGLASVPGLAIVFSNTEPASNITVPVYLDLAHYEKNNGIPFTISSNLVNAMNVSIRQKLRMEQFEFTSHYGAQVYDILKNCQSVPFSNVETKVFTIINNKKADQHFSSKMQQQKILLSSESEYLVKRDWCQLACFGYYGESEMEYVVRVLREFSPSTSSG